MGRSIHPGNVLKTQKGSGVKNALILIPDISGFTRFVHTTSLKEGRSITSELLLSILEHNMLDLEVSEVEGDAVLFYKTDEIPAIDKLLAQYKHMLNGFNEACRLCSLRFNHPLNLSLKLIAHYGEIAEYTIGTFRKLYGKPIIEAHSLLKNTIRSRSYVLITDELMSALPPIAEAHQRFATKGHKICEVHGGFRGICFTWYDYA